MTESKVQIGWETPEKQSGGSTIDSWGKKPRPPLQEKRIRKRNGNGNPVWGEEEGRRPVVEGEVEDLNTIGVVLSRKPRKRKKNRSKTLWSRLSNGWGKDCL